MWSRLCILKDRRIAGTIAPAADEITVRARSCHRMFAWHLVMPQERQLGNQSINHVGHQVAFAEIAFRQENGNCTIITLVELFYLPQVVSTA